MKLRLPHKFQAALMAALASVSITTLSSATLAVATGATLLAGQQAQAFVNTTWSFEDSLAPSYPSGGSISGLTNTYTGGTATYVDSGMSQGDTVAGSDYVLTADLGKALTFTDGTYLKEGGSAYWANGAGQLAVGSTAPNSYTVMAWVKFSSLDGELQYFGTGDGDGSGVAFGLQNGKLDLLVKGKKHYDSYGETAGLFQADTWVNIAFTYDKGTGVSDAYVNGVKVGSVTGLNTVAYGNPGGTCTYIGAASTHSAQDNFTGSIAEFSIFDGALSQRQILTAAHLGGANVQDLTWAGTAQDHVWTSTVWTKEGSADPVAFTSFSNATFSGTAASGDVTINSGVVAGNISIADQDYTFDMTGNGSLDAGSVSLAGGVTLNVKGGSLSSTGITGTGTLNITDGARVSNGATTASSTLKLSGTGTYALAAGSQNMSAGFNNDWTGTVKVSGVSGAVNFNLNTYGQTGSKVEVAGVAGYLLKNNETFAPEMVLSGDGLKLSNGFDGKSYTFAGGISGSGNFEQNWGGGAQTFTLEGDLSRWTGDFKKTGGNTTNINLNANTSSTVGAGFQGNSGTLNISVAKDTTFNKLVKGSSTVNLNLGSYTVAFMNGLELTNNNSSVTGTGKVIINTSTSGGADMGGQLGSWTGTVVLTGSRNSVNFTRLVNGTASTLELKGFTGYSSNWNKENTQNITLTNPDGGGVAWNATGAATSSNNITALFSGTWSGDGTMTIAPNKLNYKFSGDISQWGGKLQTVSSYTNTFSLTFTGNANTINAEIAGQHNTNQMNLVVDTNATFSKKVTTNTLTVNEGKTATFTTATAAPDISTLAGAGTVVLDATKSTSVATTRSGWTGTVTLTGNANGARTFSDFTNGTSSTLELKGYGGWSNTWNGTYTQNIKLTDDETLGYAWYNWASTTTNDTSYATFDGTISGDGTLEVKPDKLNYKFTGDVSGWTGAYKYTDDNYTSTLVFSGSANEINARIWDAGTGNSQLKLEVDTAATFSKDVTVDTLTINTDKSATLQGGGTLGSLAGAGALVVNSGSNTVTVNGAGGHTGTTTVNGGTLVAGAANSLGSGAVTVNGGTLDLGNFQHTNIASLTINGGTVETASSGGTGFVTGPVSINAGGTLHVTGQDVFGYNDNAITASVQMQGESTERQAVISLDFTGDKSVTMKTPLVMKGYSSITGKAINSFGGSITADGVENYIQSVWLRNNLEANVGTGGSLALGELVRYPNGQGDNPNGTLTKTGDGALTIGGGTLDKSIALNGGSLTLNGTYTLVLGQDKLAPEVTVLGYTDGSVEGNGFQRQTLSVQLVTVGGGTTLSHGQDAQFTADGKQFTLNDANGSATSEEIVDYGTFYVSAGTTDYVSKAFANGHTPTTINMGNNATLNSDEEGHTLGNITLAEGATGTVSGSSNLTIGSLTGTTGTLVFNGPEAVTLNGNNSSFTAGITVNAGTLYVTNVNSLGGGTLTTGENGTIQVEDNTVNLTVGGAGTLRLLKGSNQNTNLGTIAAPILKLGADSSHNSRYLYNNNSNLSGVGHLYFDGGQMWLSGKDMTGDDAFAGDVTFNATTYTEDGQPILSGAVMRINNSAAFNGAVAVNAYTKLAFASNSTMITFGGAVTGSGQLDLKSWGNNSGTFTIAGNASAYTGVVNSDSRITLNVTDTAHLAIGSGSNLAGAITLGGELTINGAATIGGAVTGAGSLVKAGEGTATLSSSLAGFTGSLVVNGGTLDVTNATAVTVSGLSGTGGALDMAGALTVNNADDNVYAGALELGGLTKEGAGKLTIHGLSGITSSVVVTNGILNLATGTYDLSDIAAASGAPVAPTGQSGYADLTATVQFISATEPGAFSHEGDLTFTYKGNTATEIGDDGSVSFAGKDYTTYYLLTAGDTLNLTTEQAAHPALQNVVVNASTGTISVTGGTTNPLSSLTLANNTALTLAVDTSSQTGAGTVEVTSAFSFGNGATISVQAGSVLDLTHITSGDSFVRSIVDNITGAGTVLINDSSERTFTNNQTTTLRTNLGYVGSADFNGRGWAGGTGHIMNVGNGEDAFGSLSVAQNLRLKSKMTVNVKAGSSLTVGGNLIMGHNQSGHPGLLSVDHGTLTVGHIQFQDDTTANTITLAGATVEATLAGNLFVGTGNASTVTASDLTLKATDVDWAWNRGTDFGGTLAVDAGTHTITLGAAGTASTLENTITLTSGTVAFAGNWEIGRIPHEGETTYTGGTVEGTNGFASSNAEVQLVSITGGGSIGNSSGAHFTIDSLAATLDTETGIVKASGGVDYSTFHVITGSETVSQGRKEGRNPAYSLADGATLVVDEDLAHTQLTREAGATGTATLAGGGKYTLSGTNSLGTGIVLHATDWTGTVKVTGAVNDLNMVNLGTANSTIVLDGWSGYFNGSPTITADVEIGSGGATINNGGSTYTITFAGDLSGSGDIIRANSNNVNINLAFTGDVSDYTGNIIFDRCNTSYSLNVTFSGSANEINAAALKNDGNAAGSFNVTFAAADTVVNSVVSRNTTSSYPANKLNVTANASTTFNKSVTADSLGINNASTVVTLNGGADADYSLGVVNMAGGTLAIGEQGVKSLAIADVIVLGGNTLSTLTSNTESPYAVGVQRLDISNWQANFTLQNVELNVSGAATAAVLNTAQNVDLATMTVGDKATLNLNGGVVWKKDDTQHAGKTDVVNLTINNGGAVNVNGGTGNILNDVTLNRGGALSFGTAATIEGALTISEVITANGNLTLNGNVNINGLDDTEIATYIHGEQDQQMNGFKQYSGSLTVVDTTGGGSVTVKEGTVITFKDLAGTLDDHGKFTLADTTVKYDAYYVNQDQTSESLTHALAEAEGHDTLTTVQLANGTGLDLDSADATLQHLVLKGGASASLNVTQSSSITSVAGLGAGQTLTVTGTTGKVLTLSANNTMDGTVDVQSGTLKTTAATALGNAHVDVEAAGTLELGANLTLANGMDNAGTVNLTNKALTLNGREGGTAYTMGTLSNGASSDVTLNNHVTATFDKDASVRRLTGNAGSAVVVGENATLTLTSTNRNSYYSLVGDLDVQGTLKLKGSSGDIRLAGYEDDQVFNLGHLDIDGASGITYMLTSGSVNYTTDIVVKSLSGGGTGHTLQVTDCYNGGTEGQVIDFIIGGAQDHSNLYEGKIQYGIGTSSPKAGSGMNLEIKDDLVASQAVLDAIFGNSGNLQIADITVNTAHAQVKGLTGTAAATKTMQVSGTKAEGSSANRVLEITGEGSYAYGGKLGANLDVVHSGSGTQSFGGVDGFDGSIDVEAGVLNIMNAASVAVQDVTISNATLGVYNGATATAETASEGTLTIKDGHKLTASGENAKLNANLVMDEGSTLDVSAYGGMGGLHMGSSITLNPGMFLSDKDMEGVSGLGFMDAYDLYFDVNEFFIGTTQYSEITFSSEQWVKASQVFNNDALQGKDYYVFYSGLNHGGNGGNVGTIYIMQVPEPTTGTLSLLALCALAARRRRK